MGASYASLKFVGDAVRKVRSEYSWELPETVAPKRNFLFFMETSAGLLPDCMGPTQIIWDRLPSLKSTNYGLWSRLQNTSTATLTICCSGGSVAKSCVTLGNPMNCSTPGFPVLHPPAGLAQTHVHRVCDAIQPSHPLLSPFPPAFNFPQHQGLFPWVSSSHQVVKVVELHLQHRCFQWIFSVLS